MGSELSWQVVEELDKCTKQASGFAEPTATAGLTDAHRIGMNKGRGREVKPAISPKTGEVGESANL